MEKLDKATDAFVWDVVAYLDSPSDYREYLPYPRQLIPKTDLVLLDDISCYVPASLWSLTLFVIVVFLIVLTLLQN